MGPLFKTRVMEHIPQVRFLYVNWQRLFAHIYLTVPFF